MWSASPHRVQQLRWPDIEAARELDDVEQRYVLLAAFNHADIVPMKVGQFRELFLRYAALFTQLFEPPSEHDPRVSGHARYNLYDTVG